MRHLTLALAVALAASPAAAKAPASRLAVPSMETAYMACFSARNGNMSYEGGQCMGAIAMALELGLPGVCAKREEKIDLVLDVWEWINHNDISESEQSFTIVVRALRELRPCPKK